MTKKKSRTKTIDRWAVLPPKQQEVARAFLAEREHERRHLVIAALDTWLREVRRDAW